MKKNTAFELCYSGEAPLENYVNVDLYAEFIHDDKIVKVKGFYDGDGIYKIRFLPQETGVYKWKVGGLFSDEGIANCEDSDIGGIVMAQGRNFIRNGKLFHPFGTTVYALIHQPSELVERTFTTLRKSPFNKVRMCVFPKHYEWNNNEPPRFAFAFSDGKPDTKKPDYEFWHTLEDCIYKLAELDIQCDLILFHPYDKWGFSEMDVESCDRYLDYLTRRLAAFPNIWWSLANEYDLLFAYKGQFEHFAEVVAKGDPYGHLLSNHQIFDPWNYNNEHTTHVSTQTRDIDRTERLFELYDKPVVYDEVGYEGNIPNNWGNLTAEEMIDKFWRVCVCGAYCTHGETYVTQNNGEDEVLWWAKGGELKGQSPSRIAFLRQIIESLPGKLEPLIHSLYIPYEWTYEDYLERKDKPEYDKIIHPMLKFLTREGFEIVHSFPLANMGHIDNEIYLYYLANQRPCFSYMYLPENVKYDIFVIDTQDMTKTKTMSGVSGKVKVDLPSKQYMAMLAVKTRKFEGEKE